MIHIKHTCLRLYKKEKIYCLYFFPNTNPEIESRFPHLDSDSLHAMENKTLMPTLRMTVLDTFCLISKRLFESLRLRLELLHYFQSPSGNSLIKLTSCLI